MAGFTSTGVVHEGTDPPVTNLPVRAYRRDAARAASDHIAAAASPPLGGASRGRARATVTGRLTPIRTATNTTLKMIKVGTFPAAIAITPDGRTA